jgi:hypothetical protein
MVKSAVNRSEAGANMHGAKQLVKTVGLKKNTNCEIVEESRNDEVRKANDYVYTPKPKMAPAQSRRRKAVIIVRNKAAGKTPSEAVICTNLSSTVDNEPSRGDAMNRPHDETPENNSTAPKQDDSEGLLEMAEKAFLKLGEFVGEGAVSASKNLMN